MGGKQSVGRIADARRCELYTQLVATFALSDSHHAELKTKRGFTDDTIARLRFCSGGEHAFDLVRDVQRACSATDDEMRAAGLLVPRKKDGKLFAWGQLLDDRILIPYLKADGQTVYHLRPHKLGFSADVAGVQLYCEYTALGWPEDEVLVLTEGEFKAAAAAQLGFRALAVPGVASFGGKHFARLEKAIRQVPHKKCVVMFDRETKADPALPGYKDDFRKRYDTEWWSWLMAHRLNAEVAPLPESWMDNGKIDIDGALAAGRSRADFEALVRNSTGPARYLDTLPEEAGTVIAKRVRAYRNEEKPKGLKIFDSRAGPGYGYTWYPPGEDSQAEIVSDFILKLDRVVQTDEQVERIVRVVDRNGETSAPLVVKPADMASMRAWRQWCAAKGNYNWYGKQYHLDAVFTHLHNQHDGSLIRRTALGGEIEPGLWVFQNGVITNSRYIPPREADGLAWVGRRGFEMADLEGQPRLLRDDPDGARVLGSEHRDMLRLLLNNLKQPTMWLALGWGLATVFSRVLFARFKCFPLLYHMGEAGSGKTTAARWLLNGFFGIDTQGKPMMSTEKSQYRLLAKRCSLAAWFDEFREGRDMQRHITAFCSIYNRQGYSRAKRTGGLETDSVPVRGSLLLGGVVPPKDDQLLSRCLILMFNADARDNRGDDDGGTYGRIEAELERLNDFFIHAVLRYDELVADVVAETLVAKSVFQKRTKNARVSLNYAMAVAAFHVICGDLVDSRVLLDFAEECMRSSGDRLREEHPLADFWEAVASMAAMGDIDKDHLDADDDALYLWLPGIFQAYERQHRMRRGDVTFRVSDVANWIAAQPYWIAPDERNRRTMVRRINGRPKRVTAIRRDVAPDPLTEAYAHIVRPPPGPETATFI